MNIELTDTQISAHEGFRSFVDKEIAPLAEKFDREERIPVEIIREMARRGYLGAFLPECYGGKMMDMATYGLLCEEIGRGSASLLSLLTVHGMVSLGILRWGNSAQKEYWLPRLASGETIGAFALTEPDIGSDARNVEASAETRGSSFVLKGEKKWISCGQIADLFLIIARCEGKPTAFLVEKNAPHLRIEPMGGLLGFRAAMLAQLSLESCEIPLENLVGKVGFGFSHVAGAALDFGRYCIACGCVGLAQACIDATLHYASGRKQGGHYLRDHQLIQEMIAEMIAGSRAARLLCRHAGALKDLGDPESIMETCIAKYFASRISLKAASDAVQIHGAQGCAGDFPVERYFRDAKIMEIIEGSSQIQQIMISKHAFETMPLRKE
jgi:glutaryl-CoA dehydrogenase (non-decarboxylating)